MPFSVKEQADQIVEQLKAKGYEIGHIMDDQEKGLVDETQVPKTRTVGGERVALKAIEDFGFIEILQSIGLKPYQQKVAVCLIIGRLVANAIPTDG